MLLLHQTLFLDVLHHDLVFASFLARILLSLPLSSLALLQHLSKLFVLGAGLSCSSRPIRYTALLTTGSSLMLLRVFLLQMG